MTNPNEFAAAWQDATADLTPEERALLAKATPADWAKATAELITDPGFWGEMAVSFAEGLARGLENRR